jgi:hypothetical protein
MGELGAVILAAAECNDLLMGVCSLTGKKLKAGQSEIHAIRFGISRQAPESSNIIDLLRINS